MADLKVGAEPGEVGFDADRLRRIDSHFARYVDDGSLPGWLIAVSRRGRLVHLSTYGRRDIEADLPVEIDTLWRIYSMTKPITSVAAMMLYEQGLFELTDPVSRYIPAFAGVRVYVKGSALKPFTVPASEPIRIWHLLTHTSGLTYGFFHANAVDEMYRARGFEVRVAPGVDLAAGCEMLAELPLLFQPGAEWNYSMSTDVLGRVIEVVSGRSLDQFFAERIFGPLGMTETAFSVPPRDADRLAALYTPNPADGRAMPNELYGQGWTTPPTFLAGGGGLVSTAGDYHRFTQLLVRGGELDGVRLLGTRTLRYMTRNHLPGGLDLEAFGRPVYAETPNNGVGFGLGFSVVIDPAASRVLCSPGEFAWGGLASTAFWVDPMEEITAMLFTQLMPSNVHPLRPQLRTLVNQALVD